jgi:Mor family transcriptional regulator
MCAVEKCILPEVVFTVPTSENTPTSKHFQVLQSEIDLLKSQLEKALSDVPEALQSSLKHFEATEKNASNPILNLPTHEAEKPEKTADTSKHFEATESKKIGFEVPTSKSTTDTSEKVKRQFEALLARYHNGKAKYLQKYRQAVEHTLQLQNAAMPTVDICKEVSQKFDVSTSTFYNILRIINNTDK